MKEIKYYEADDGTEFDTAEECIEYENRFSYVVDKIIFIQDNKIMNPKDTNLRYCCEWCTAIYIPHEESIEIVSEMFSDFDCENPLQGYCRPGLYYYDDYWHCLDVEIEKLENQKEFFMNLIGME